MRKYLVKLQRYSQKSLLFSACSQSSSTRDVLRGSTRYRQNRQNSAVDLAVLVLCFSEHPMPIPSIPLNFLSLFLPLTFNLSLSKPQKFKQITTCTLSKKSPNFFEPIIKNISPIDWSIDLWFASCLIGSDWFFSTH